jgi:hypothetical protein
MSDDYVTLRVVHGIVQYGLNLAGLGKGQFAGTCKCGKELSGSIKCGELLD